MPTDSQLPVTNNFISGKISPAKVYFESIDHFKNQPTARCADSDVLDLVKAIIPAQNAFKEWKISSLDDRLLWLDRFRHAIELFKAEFIQATATDLSLPITFIERSDYIVATQILDSLKNELKIAQEQTLENQRSTPVGPTAFVLSAQFPLRQVVRFVLPSLLAGNSVLIKPSSLSVQFQNVFIKMLADLNMEPGLVQVMNGKQVGFKNFLVAHPGIKALCVVGSHETLIQVHKTLQPAFAQTYKPIKFLGGAKNAAIVLSDFDEVLAKNVLETFLIGQGQLHWNSTRLFILEKNRSSWHDYIQHVFENLKPSEGIEDPSPWTPLIRESSFEKYNSILQTAKSDQAKLLTTRQASKPFFVSPTFTEDMSNCSTLQQDQVGAPLFILSTVKYPFDIPKYANVSYYGDTANIWAPEGKAEKIISELAVANVVLNRWSIDEPNLEPGLKQSSYGILDHRIFSAFHARSKAIF